MYQKEVNEFAESTPVKDFNPAFTSQENYDLSNWNDSIRSEKQAEEEK